MSSIWMGERVRLRAIEPDDAPHFRRFDEHSEHMRSVDELLPPRSAAGYARWAEEQALTDHNGDEFQLAVAALDTDEPVGALSTTGICRRSGRFRYGIGIGAEHQRRGYATDAVRVLLRYMFAERGFHKCVAEVFACNTASLALQRRLGFTREGCLREHEYFAGGRHDLVVFGLTAPAFGG